jgi:hypothetical protein
MGTGKIDPETLKAAYEAAEEAYRSCPGPSNVQQDRVHKAVDAALNVVMPESRATHNSPDQLALPYEGSGTKEVRHFGRRPRSVEDIPGL